MIFLDQNWSDPEYINKALKIHINSFWKNRKSAVVEQEQYDRIPILQNYQELVDTICGVENPTNLEENQPQQDRIESHNEYFVKIDGNFFPCTSGLLFMITVIHKFVKIEGFIDAQLLADFLNIALEVFYFKTVNIFFKILLKAISYQFSGDVFWEKAYWKTIPAK